MKNLVVCGGGSSAHTLIPLLNHSDFNVSLYTSRPENWSKTVSLEWLNPSGEVLGVYSGELEAVSDSPRELFPSADYIVFCMPVHQYRKCLHEIAPYLARDKQVFIGTVYGQGGWNWMVDEIKKEQGLTNIVTFAFGLIPWICRIREYGHTGITYGFKERTYAAVYPNEYFEQVRKEFFDQICFRWFGIGKTEQSENFLSLTLSVDNQIIHTSRCLGLYKVYGKTWDRQEDVPWFYKDYDDLSADLLGDLDKDYSAIREAIKAMYPEKDFRFMLDYLSLDRYSYNADENENIKDSFLNSVTLCSIGTPVVKNAAGKWELDRNYRFFMDDIYYGNCIAKWMAEQLGIKTPTIDEILRWAEDVRGERFLDENDHLIVDSPDLCEPLKSGLPCYYGFKTIQDCVD
ncbi:MAG: NAD/NADP octopine/nopaline dehydrogenase family protein [Lachnospiraceae bacterium]|nr:NAD/NADP octopine/nopaline dehydrogenase family protein [Lachnospiraceae bacterium]